ncbi:hypothetical protein HB943_10725 [Listeria weihenstephanensis]|uniref:NlpC/P60 domain-containing protein n=1 Tax=Listeria weihenstephanensis TaxID=1006155 RepID=A0A841Z9D0_9LIST|nr:peptidoglycan-binding protein [Listeria weihenstephanensis]MBC1501077.1 hypothetical protein [Listeria weihenstephanensis]
MKKILNSLIVSAILVGGYQLTAEIIQPTHAQAATMQTVQMGSNGEAVKTLQNALNARGYKLLADGSFGQLTKNAVINFQVKNGLYQDGVVGAKTWAALGYGSSSTTGQVGTQTQKIINYVNGKVGSSYPTGKCQAFVRESYEQAGIVSKTTAGSAKIAADMWSRSSSQSNIPIGACVYFQGTKANSYLGHVGIYVGNGDVVHATGGKVWKQSLSYMTQHGFPFRSWGYQAGVQPN